MKPSELGDEARKRKFPTESEIEMDARMIEAQEDANYLASLNVWKTTDEFGEARYFICDFQGDMVGEAYSTPEAAFAEIDRMRNA
jgi:hypothetical protein